MTTFMALSGWMADLVDTVQHILHDNPGTTVACLVVLMLWLLTLGGPA